MAESTTRYLDLRIELELLRDEFLGALDQGWRVQHQLLSAIGHPPSPSDEAWQGFVRANQGRLIQPGEWEVFDPFPTGGYCSRYHGFEISNALDEFKTLASNGFRILETIADEVDGGLTVPAGLRLEIPRAEVESGYEPSLAEFGWIQLLYETARLWPTGLVRVEPELFWGDPEFETGEEFEELAKQTVTPKDGNVPYPAFPLVESLQSDLFRSSAEALAMWLNPADVLELDTWRGAIPVYLPVVEDAPTPAPATEKSQEQRAIPEWDGKRLYYDGTLIREYGEEAERQRAILDTFAHDGWSESVENPLPSPYDTSGHLSDTLYHLNKELSPELIHFQAFSNRVYWLAGPRPAKRREPPAPKDSPPT